jgi:hypothetical protein
MMLPVGSDPTHAGLLWVSCVVLTLSQTLPIYAQLRTLRCALTAAMGHNRTHAPHPSERHLSLPFGPQV